MHKQCKLLKADQPHPCDYPHMPTNETVQTGERMQTDKHTVRWTLPSALSPCFAKAMHSIMTAPLGFLALRKWKTKVQSMKAWKCNFHRKLHSYIYRILHGKFPPKSAYLILHGKFPPKSASLIQSFSYLELCFSQSEIALPSFHTWHLMGIWSHRHEGQLAGDPHPSDLQPIAERRKAGAPPDFP